ncbi:MAG TPA: hypothetical protein PKE19_10375, partial [Aestuariivirga sp.]|nr:hypothetical protein [Aestuariivirga sp.]
WANALDQLQRTLNSVKQRDAHWSIWVVWYESVARDGRAFGLPATSAEDVEKRIALGGGREDFWDRYPATINAEISQWVAEARQKLSDAPAQRIDEQALKSRPASIETAITNGTIDLAPPTPVATIGKDVLRPAAQDTAQELADLAALAKSKNADERHIGLLSEASQKVGRAPDNSVDLFASGRLHEALTRLAVQVNDEWDTSSAARYQAVMLQFDRTLKKFPEWRLFLAQPHLPTAPPERARLIEAARDFIGSLEIAPTAVASRVRDAARELIEAEGTLASLDDLYLADLVESCLNILRSAAQGFLNIYGREFAQRFKEKWPDVPKDHADTLIALLKGPKTKTFVALIGTWWAGSTGWLSVIWDFISKHIER